MQHGLYVIIAGSQIGEAFPGITIGLCIDHSRLTRFESVHIHTKYLSRFYRIAHLLTWFGFIGFGQNKEYTPIQRFFTLRRREGDRERS